MSQQSPATQIELWPIDKLIFYKRNPRKNDAAVDRMAASIREFGFKIPVLARSNGEVVDGHLRLKGARKLGITEIPVTLCDEWTEEQVRTFRLTVNRSATWAEWDDELLALELLDLKDLDFDIALTGFDDEEIARLVSASAAAEELTDEDAVPELPKTPTSLAGDLWALGAHKLLVGDATNQVDVTTLMAGELADLAFNDPPYNCGYEGYTPDSLTIKNDDLSPEEFDRFLRDSFASLRSIVKADASLYVCHSSSYQREFQNALELAGFKIRCQIIWAKNTFAWGFGRYKFQHEPIFYCHVASEKDRWYGDKTQSTLWEENKPSANRLHPTMKPVELIERALINSSKIGDIVVDLFGGSGSTLIGCERRGRRVRLMEIDPKYADCIICRYQEFSGKQAVLEGDGRTFDEIAIARAKA